MKYLLLAFISAAFIISSCSSKPSVVLSEKHDGNNIAVKKGDIFEVRLEARLGTGYSWKLKDLPGSVKIEEESIQKLENQLKTGGIELQVFRCRAVAEDMAELIFIYNRAWEKDKAPVKKINYNIQISR